MGQDDHHWQESNPLDIAWYIFIQKDSRAKITDESLFSLVQ